MNVVIESCRIDRTKNKSTIAYVALEGLFKIFLFSPAKQQQWSLWALRVMELPVEKC